MKSMRKTSKCVLLPAFAAFCLYGETAGEVKLDNPQAHVLAVTVQPNETSSLAEPVMNQVLVFRDAGQLMLKSAGNVEKINVREGDAHWTPAGVPYTIGNTTDHPIRFFEIELKTKAQGPAPVSKLDPTIVDSQHYKVEFENDQVRVLRIHFGPMEKSALHEHMLNRIVCYLNDQGRTKAGDVRMSGPATHTEAARDHCGRTRGAPFRHRSEPCKAPKAICPPGVQSRVNIGDFCISILTFGFVSCSLFLSADRSERTAKRRSHIAPDGA